MLFKKVIKWVTSLNPKQARHLDVPSRLLDVTLNERVALYFAVKNPKYHGEDGHVWIYTSFKYPDQLRFDATTNSRIKNSYCHFSAGKEDRELINQINPFDPQKISLLHNSYFLDSWYEQIAEQRKHINGVNLS